MRKRTSLHGDRPRAGELPVQEDVDREIEAHLEMVTERLVGEEGWDQESARREAERRFGDLGRVRRKCVEITRARDRTVRRAQTWEGIMQDVRYTLRSLARSPGFSGVAILTLALGIGASTAIFSVVNGVLLRPLPYPAPEELVMVHSAFPTLGFHEFWISPPEYRELQERTRSYQGLGAFRQTQVSIGGAEQPLRVSGAVASAELFQVLGVEAARGRAFTREEDHPDAEPVVVLSHGIWQDAFGSDPDLVGRTIPVNGVSRTVVGIMPPGFDVDESGIEVWTPVALPTNPENRGSHFLHVVGRLAPGVSAALAQAELDQIVSRWSEENPGVHAPVPDNHPMFLRSLQDEVVGDVRTALLLLLGAVGFVLLIACANVANLLLARSETRQKEIAVRAAMGAGRSRLARQFLTEGLVLAGAGAVAGVALAWVGLKLLLTLGAASLPRTGEIGLDGTVLLFTAGVAVVTGLLFGMAPAVHLAARAVGETLRDGSGRTTAGRGRAGFRRGLVVSEVALAVVLVVGSALMIRSFTSLVEVDPGFDPEGVLTFQLFVPATDYPEAEEVVDFQQRLGTELASIPGVRSVAFMSGLPPSRDLNANDTEFEGLERTPDGPAHNVDFYQTVSAGYLEAMEIQVTEGRGFLPGDGGGALPVAVVNESLARLFFPGESALGRRLRPCCGDEVPWFEVVGIVADVKNAGVEAPSGTELYLHHPQVAAAGQATRSWNAVVRTDLPLAALAPLMRETVWRLDRSLPVANLRPMTDVLSSSIARARFLTLLMGLFAGLALVLAAIGTYAVMSYSVAERARELGIRMAVGAQAGSVRSLVLGQGMRVAGAGLAVGILGAWVLSGLLESLLFGVAATDGAAFLAAPIVLGVVALLACWLPARRATAVDPLTVLRQE